MNDFTETLYNGYGQMFRVDELLYEAKTEHQSLKIFKNPMFGRVMTLDGIVQTTERDEFIYHEMLAHVPILAHGKARRILVIGGGDGGTLREVFLHKTVERVTLVEIDRSVIDMCKKYFPNHSCGAFEDSRLQIIIEDGFRYVAETNDRFDVIISDSTDPIGPGEVLFRKDYYTACKQCLTEGGVLVTQNGVAFMQPDEIKTTAGHLRAIFKDWHFYGAAIPTYVGGIMTFGWATEDKQLRKIGIDILQERYKAFGLQTRYYNPEVHVASFALPQYILNAIGKKDNA